MSIDIKRRDGSVVYHSDDATSVKDAVVEAVEAGAYLGGAYLGGADLRGAYLRGAYLRGAYLRGAYLRGAYLRGADLGGADLRGAYLRGADLRGAEVGGAYLGGAYLRGADLRGAYLRGADLRGAYLRGAYLRGAYLGGADLRGADLRGAYLGGAYLPPFYGLSLDAGPSGRGALRRVDAEGKCSPDGDQWLVSIGCWEDRTLDDLRALIADEVDWPEAEGDERDRRRPYLVATLALCEAHIAYQRGES